MWLGGLAGGRSKSRALGSRNEWEDVLELVEEDVEENMAKRCHPQRWFDDG